MRTCKANIAHRLHILMKAEVRLRDDRGSESERKTALLLHSRKEHCLLIWTGVAFLEALSAPLWGLRPRAADGRHITYKLLMKEDWLDHSVEVYFSHIPLLMWTKFHAYVNMNGHSCALKGGEC